ncbi:MAG: outer membrane lipoprotein carrier protein LolA [Planctomycetes bacterium]|nr:outer membrane lipoprotein carrier protein LolA [Planctomycetota bacterium]
MSRVRPGVTGAQRSVATASVVCAAALWAAAVHGTPASADDAPPAAAGPAAPSTVPAAADAKAVEAMTPADRTKHLDALLAKLSEALSKVKSVRAAFTQTKRLEVFGGDVVTRGTLAFRVPDRFRWETTEPIRTALVVNGAKCLRTRTSRKGDVVETAFDLATDPVAAATVQQVFLWTTGDFAKAATSYEIALVSEAPMAIRATPTDERIRKVISAVDVEFAADPIRLVRVALAERAGTRTEIAFSTVEHNPELADELFAVERKR